MTTQRPTKKLANLAVAALEDLKGVDIKLIDVSKHTSITDWWIVCTGTSNRHVRSLAENVVLKAKEADERPRGIQGLEKSEWVLVDLGSVVVHVLQLQARAHYQLEKLIPEPLPPMAIPKPPVHKGDKRDKGGKGKSKAKGGKSAGGKKPAPKRAPGKPMPGKKPAGKKKPRR